MNNTDKLLRAFIDAMGYEVEEVFDKERFKFESDLAHGVGVKFNGDRGDYIDYKVTKKVTKVKSFDKETVTTLTLTDINQVIPCIIKPETDVCVQSSGKLLIMGEDYTVTYKGVILNTGDYGANVSVTEIDCADGSSRVYISLED